MKPALTFASVVVSGASAPGFFATGPRPVFSSLVQGQALLFVCLQVLVFAWVAFPKNALVDSFRVALVGRGQAEDAAEMAIGVFSALGRASLIAGFNFALVTSFYSIFGHAASPQVAPLLLVSGAGLLYGLILRVFVILPLEQIAHARLPMKVSDKKIINKTQLKRP